MTSIACEMESQILESARSGQISEVAQQHLATCSSCTAALQVDRLLAVDAKQIPSLTALPDPTVVWWRARQQARIRQAERATLPIQFAERLALTLGAIGLVIGLSLIWPMIRATSGRWLGGWAMGLVQALPLGGMPLVLALFCSLLLLVGFGLYSQWADG